MTLQELQDQVLQLPLGDRWRLVQSLLSSIQQETLVVSPQPSNIDSLVDLEPWTESLIGVIQLGAEDPTGSYADYLEEKHSFRCLFQ